MGRKVDEQFKFETDTDKLRYEVGQRIKELREAKEESQEAFSEHIGIAKGTYQKLENGYSELKTEYLYKVAKYCDCNISFLLGEEDIAGYHTFTNKYICDETGISEETAEALINADSGQLHFIEEVIESCLINKDGFYYSLMDHILFQNSALETTKNEWFEAVQRAKSKIETEHPELKPPTNYTDNLNYSPMTGKLISLIDEEMIKEIHNKYKFKILDDKSKSKKENMKLNKMFYQHLLDGIHEETQWYFTNYYLSEYYKKFKVLDLQNALAIYLNGGK